jgi:hypothetical protein
MPLTFEEPTEIRLAINLCASITIPATILARVDEVIE